MSIKTNSKKLKVIQFKDVISILIVLTIISLSVCSVLGASVFSTKPVTDRNLAMFASIAYADLENIDDNLYNINPDNNFNKPNINVFTQIKPNDLVFEEKPMVTDGQLRTINSDTTLLGIPLSDELENTYDYLFYGLASTDEVKDWKIVNYTKFNTTIMNGTAQFSAMTFKRGNDIVIAYRGTDFNDIGDWTQDIFYGLVGYAGQEGVTQDYAKAVAKHYAANNNNVRIYVTGHSLGGYLAQIGGSALAGDEEFKDNLKEVVYFNGMGLHFWSNVMSTLNLTKRNKFNISTSEYNLLKNVNSKLNKVQFEAEEDLTVWKNNGGKLISYHINGDLISSLGTHVGEEKGFDAHNICIAHHKGNQPSTNLKNIIMNKLTKTIGKALSIAFNKRVEHMVDVYRPAEPLDYVWITHETDSFFGVLPYEDGSLPTDIEIELKVPETIKARKTATATLIINVTNGRLNNTTLSKDILKLSRKTGLSISSISKPTIKNTNQGIQYIYKITLKGGIVVGNTTITINPGALKVIPNRNFPVVPNNLVVSNSIRTKL